MCDDIEARTVLLSSLQAFVEHEFTYSHHTLLDYFPNWSLAMQSVKSVVEEKPEAMGSGSRRAGAPSILHDAGIQCVGECDELGGGLCVNQLLHADAVSLLPDPLLEGAWEIAPRR